MVKEWNELKEEERVLVRWENELINHRLSWLALFLIAGSFAWSAQSFSHWGRFVICVIGLLATFSSDRAIAGSNKVLKKIEGDKHRWWMPGALFPKLLVVMWLLGIWWTWHA
jgi:hypothetical protein